MNVRILISVTMMCALFALSHVVQAQTLKNSTENPTRPAAGASTTLKAADPGRSNFPACCESCPAGGCTGCNTPANTPNLNCGSGLIKAKCQVVDNTSTCVKDE